MRTRTVSAADLHIGDLVVPADGPARRAGQPENLESPASQPLTVVSAEQSSGQ